MPNSSRSSVSSSAIEQLIFTKLSFRRTLIRWMARAINSFPDPASPKINSGASLRAAFIAKRSIRLSSGVSPTISSRLCSARVSSSIVTFMDGHCSHHDRIDSDCAMATLDTRKSCASTRKVTGNAVKNLFSRRTDSFNFGKEKLYEGSGGGGFGLVPSIESGRQLDRIRAKASPMKQLLTTQALGVD
jgi:hypothetical protein